MINEAQSFYTRAAGDPLMFTKWWEITTSDTVACGVDLQGLKHGETGHRCTDIQ